jgi:hypothetical protein
LPLRRKKIVHQKAKLSRFHHHQNHLWHSDRLGLLGVSSISASSPPPPSPSKESPPPSKERCHFPRPQTTLTNSSQSRGLAWLTSYRNETTGTGLITHYLIM